MGTHCNAVTSTTTKAVADTRPTRAKQLTRCQYLVKIRRNNPKMASLGAITAVAHMIIKGIPSFR